jgi:hypothetical protein
LTPIVLPCLQIKGVREMHQNRGVLIQLPKIGKLY